MVIREAYRVQRDILAGYGGTVGVGVGLRISGVKAPGLIKVCDLDTGGQAGKLLGQAARAGLEVGLAQNWVKKLISSLLLILELEPNG